MTNAGKAKSVAVLGGGVAGCCTALVLAQRGARVVLFDRADELFARTSLHNEGKIHFGYVYAGDPGLATARQLVRGSLHFAPFLKHYLDLAPDNVELSCSHTYLVHRRSQRSLDQITGYFSAVHGLVQEAAGGAKDRYFGADLSRAPRRWSAGELEGVFNSEKAIAAFGTEELAVDPYALAPIIRARIAANSNIEVRLKHTVRSVSQSGNKLCVLAEGPHGEENLDYDHVVNALWDGRLAIDNTLGYRPARPWLYRFRYGLRFEARDILKAPLSLTVVHGPFGGVVCYEHGAMYLEWYPACMVGMSNALEPPDRPAHAPEPLRSRIMRDTISALGEIIPAVGSLSEDACAGASVVGGNIFAWGATDTDDPASGLHQRYEIGVTSSGNYHSLDPGKFSMAPYFAEICADRIVPS